MLVTFLWKLWLNFKIFGIIFLNMCYFFSWTVLSESPSQDSLDAFMSEMKSGSTLDGVSRKKLHLRTFELRKEQQRLKGLIKIVKPAEIPELKK